MTFLEYKESLDYSQPPENISVFLVALWYDANGKWRMAHDIVQELNHPEAHRIHAYLHRREGDQSNAAYWYSRAHVPIYTRSISQEWEELVNHHLG